MARRARSRPYGLALLLILAPATLQAQIYRWVDGDGRVHFGDRPPADAGAERLETGPAPDPAAVRARKRAMAEIRREADILASDRGRRERKEAARAERERRMAAAVEAHCSALERELRVLTAGGGVYYEHEDGTQAFISQADRDARIAELRAGLAADCTGP